jgi:hypothetical protein
MTFKTVVNCTTGTVEQVELTPEELEQRDLQQKQALERQAAEDKAQKETAAKKLSGREKLLSLGLTEAEVTALLG